ncbi:MAG: endo alpha-1,4 polygalactosaminidase [Nocardioides sp.]|nr:endo alpha-1,4 polygalactosaminidase [Nocardioides sp.]
MGLLLSLLSAVPTVAAGVTTVPAGTDVDDQLGGPGPTPANVGIVVRDRTEAPQPGAYNVCYVNAFQTQPDARSFWKKRPGLLLRQDGRPVLDEVWGEFLLDLRTLPERAALARIVGRWTAGCAAVGFDAVELDKLDSFTRSDGLLRRRDALAYARLLVGGAHAQGLAVAQKNLAGLDGTRLGFDFAVAEECGRYDECGSYVEHYGEQVLAVEYRPRDFAVTCAGWGATLPVVLRDREVTPDGVHRWC